MEHAPVIRQLPISYRALVAFLAVMLPLCCCSIRITADVLNSETLSTSMSSCCNSCTEAPGEDAPDPDCGDKGCGCCLKAPDTSQSTIDLSCLAILSERHPIEAITSHESEIDEMSLRLDAADTSPADDPATAARARRITLTPQV
jgi:hypothetical protein